MFWKDLHHVSLVSMLQEVYVPHEHVEKLSESRDKSALLLIISDSLFRGWIAAVSLLTVKRRKGKRLVLFWGTR